LASDVIDFGWGERGAILFDEGKNLGDKTAILHGCAGIVTCMSAE